VEQPGIEGGALAEVAREAHRQNPRRARQPRRRTVGRSVVDRDDFSSGHRAAQLGQHGVDVILFVEKWHNDAGVGRHDFVDPTLRSVSNLRVEILKQLGYKSRGGIFSRATAEGIALAAPN